MVAGALCGIGGVIVAAGVGGFDPNSWVTYVLPDDLRRLPGHASTSRVKFNRLGTLIGRVLPGHPLPRPQELTLGTWNPNVFYGAALIIAMMLTTLLPAPGLKVPPPSPHRERT